MSIRMELASPERRHAVVACTLFDRTAIRHNCGWVIEGARILAIAPRRELPAALPIRHLPERAWLAPGFIDTQVNGGGDVLFNDNPSPEGIGGVVAGDRRFGTTALLPTLLSDTAERMRAARDAVEAMVGADPSVIGIHYEGPFLSFEKRGVHDAGM